MSESDFNDENFSQEQDDEYNVNVNTNGARTTRQNNFQIRQQQNEDFQQERTERTTIRNSLQKNYYQNEREVNKYIYEDDPGENIEEEEQGPPDVNILNPEIDQILWKRTATDGQLEYLCKYKEYSYLHVKWLTEKTINDIAKDIKQMKNKINRFNKAFERKISEMLVEDWEDCIENQKFFDQTYLEVDKILQSNEIFPIIHPKKANDVKGKWTEPLLMVCSKLVNFAKDGIMYGIQFNEPVHNEKKEAYQEYLKIVPNPVDLGTITNRLYLDYYKTAAAFWSDLGQVWKNTNIYYKNYESDMVIVSNVLRDISIELYKQWYYTETLKFEQLKKENQSLFDFSQEEQLTEAQQKLYLNIQEQLKQIELVKFIIQAREEKNVQKLQQIQQVMHPEKFQALQKFMSEVYNIESQRTFYLKQLQNQSMTLPKDYQLKLKEIQISYSGQSLEAFFKNQPTLKNSSEMKDIQEKLQQLQDKKESTIYSELSKILPECFEELSDQKKVYYNILQNIKQNIENQIENIKNRKRRRSENNFTIDEIFKIHPGSYSLNYFEEESENLDENHSSQLTLGDLEQLDMSKESEKIYLVKWKNLSYLEATWEQESQIFNQDKITEYRQFNRALDKESRQIAMSQLHRHNTLLDLELNPRKKAKTSFSQITELKNKLYYYDVSHNKKCFQYTQDNQPIFKGRKLLREYQLQSLNWLIQSWYNKRNVILADEMGLGKTIQSIAFLNHLVQFESVKGPFLVIAPLGTLDHWKKTVDEWTNLNGILYYDSKGQDGRACCRYYEEHYTDISTKGSILQAHEIFKFHILITSNEVFMQDCDHILLNVPFQFVVVDEAHRLKNQNAKLLQHLKKLPCKRTLLLTGTPIQNNTDELFTLLNHIEPNHFNSQSSFKSRYGDVQNQEQVMSLQSILKPFLLRRMKEDVEKSIPALQETIIDIEMTTIQKTIYKGLYENNKEMLIKNFSQQASNINMNNLEMQLRKCCNHPFLIKEIENELNKEVQTIEQRMELLIQVSGKMILLDKLLCKFKSEGQKVLIFSQFTYVLVLIEEYLKYKNHRYEKIDGSVKSKDRFNSIERFNADDRNFVFLLSTKAGGIGLNLSSASMVIIYDSDWNPQNDVQATARAHRIGQQKEVKVYRFVTKKTYESQMFERATRKLGLDQAIFLGDQFKGKKKEQADSKKIEKEEVENLLKKGILGLLEEEKEISKTYFENNIEDILKNNTRQGNYNTISGQYTVQKHEFVAEKTDRNVNMDDPDFWKKILKTEESKTQKLYQQLLTKDKNFPVKEQQEFMIELAQHINTLIESKLTLINYNADEEKNINDCLNKLSIMKNIYQKYKDIVFAWIFEVPKPSRRYKKYKNEDFEIENEVIPKRKKRLERMEQSDQEEKVEDDNKIEYENKAPANIKNKDELLKTKICQVCEKTKCTYVCIGPCKRTFHAQCMKNHFSKDPQDIKITPDELNLDDLTLKELLDQNYGWKCDDCSKGLYQCFICKKKGTINTNKKGAKNKQSLILDEKINDDNIFNDEAEEDMLEKNTETIENVVKCSNCPLHFHQKCIEGNKQFKYSDKTRFRCSQHYCKKCKESADTMACSRCPNSFHNKCLSKDTYIKLSKKYIICPEHVDEIKAFKNAEEIIQNKQEELFSDEENYNNVKIQKKKKVEEKVKSKKHKHSRETRESNRKPEPRPAVEEESYTRSRRSKREKQEEPQQEFKETRQTKLKFKEKQTYLTYGDFDIPSPEQFDYQKYKGDWCRFCGARFSSNFTKGPWGPRTLCTVHYIAWGQKKKLQLDEKEVQQYIYSPSKPIDPVDPQELKYMNDLIRKNPDVNFRQELEDKIQGAFEEQIQNEEKIEEEKQEEISKE